MINVTKFSRLSTHCKFIRFRAVLPSSSLVGQSFEIKFLGSYDDLFQHIAFHSLSLILSSCFHTLPLNWSWTAVNPLVRQSVNIGSFEAVFLCCIWFNLHPYEISWLVEHHFANVFLCRTVWIILFVFWLTRFHQFYQRHMSVWCFMWKPFTIISNLLIQCTVLSTSSKGVLALYKPRINCAAKYCIICSSGWMQNILTFNLFCFFITPILNTLMLYIHQTFYFMPLQRM